MSKSDLLSGKSILVTGAAGGIGRAAVLRFVENGAAVMATDIDDAGAQETAELARRAGGAAESVRCDVSDTEQVRAAVRSTVEAFGRLDGAFNNAGWEGQPAALAEYDESAWNRIISINLTGVFLCIRHELAVMLQQGTGAIVNTASISGLIGNREFVPYNATKHGVLGLTKGTALETATTGVRVNAVCPGYVDTEMLARVGAAPGSEARALAEAAHPMNRLARPDEIADAAAWLLSDSASFVTGQSIVVDGGYVAQ